MSEQDKNDIILAIQSLFMPRFDTLESRFDSLDRKVGFIENTLFDFQLENEKNHSYTHKLLTQLTSKVSDHETRIQILEKKYV